MLNSSHWEIGWLVLVVCFTCLCVCLSCPAIFGLLGTWMLSLVCLSAFGCLSVYLWCQTVQQVSLFASLSASGFLACLSLCVCLSVIDSQVNVSLTVRATPQYLQTIEQK